MTTATHAKQSPAATPIAIGAHLLQRKCACGTHAPDGAPCSACARKGLLRRDTAGRQGGDAPGWRGRVVPEGGQPLETTARSFMESHFRHDFSGVRVHTGGEAADAARAFGARAYAIGSDVVFGHGQYAPASEAGRRLLAHELAHVVQQGGSRYAGGPVEIGQADSAAEHAADAAADAIGRGPAPPVGAATAKPALSRACLSDAECKGGSEGSLTKYVKDVESEPKNMSAADKRKAACGKTPPDAACTGDGHGAIATELTALMKERAPERLSFVDGGLHIDKDIPDAYGAYTLPCGSFTPPQKGTMCTFVPVGLERAAAAFKNPATKQISCWGQTWERQAWLTAALSTITHESEHARFDTAPDLAKPSASACDFATIKSDLSELAAIVSSFAVVERRSRAKPVDQRSGDLQWWFQTSVVSKKGERSETIAGVVHAVRCACACGDADAYIKRTVDFATSGWNTYQKATLHQELKDPKWKLNWPCDPPTVNVNDLPDVTPTIDVRDLPAK